jgi:transcriptional regulator with XRE-family HTH domain
MDGGELQTVREYLGLTIDALARLLEVNPRTVRSWEGGRDLIPARVRGELAGLETITATAVVELVAELGDTSDRCVLVYRRDADLHAARPDCAEMPARWWRHVVARARETVPGVQIVSD